MPDPLPDSSEVSGFIKAKKRVLGSGLRCGAHALLSASAGGARNIRHIDRG
jgi:hypothetical protein